MMQWFLAQHRIRPQIRFSSREEHESRLHALAERLDRVPNDLLKDSLADLLAKHEASTFGALLATQASPDTDRPLIHACLLTDVAATPLCGAAAGPWSPRTFDYLRLTCYECQSLILEPKQ